MTPTEQTIYHLQQRIKNYKRKDDFYHAELYESKLGVYVMENVSYVCSECGNKYGTANGGVTTCHLSSCDVCGQKEVLTAVRNFNYLMG